MKTVNGALRAIIALITFALTLFAHADSSLPIEELAKAKPTEFYLEPGGLTDSEEMVITWRVRGLECNLHMTRKGDDEHTTLLTGDTWTTNSPATIKLAKELRSRFEPIPEAGRSFYRFTEPAKLVSRTKMFVFERTSPVPSATEYMVFDFRGWTKLVNISHWVGETPEIGQEIILATSGLTSRLDSDGAWFKISVIDGVVNAPLGTFQQVQKWKEWDKAQREDAVAKWRESIVGRNSGAAPQSGGTNIFEQLDSVEKTLKRASEILTSPAPAGK